MQVETLKDVLHWTGEFHGYLSCCLEHCANENESARAKLLLNYLSQHENTLSLTVGRFEENADARALNTWCAEYLAKNPIVPHEKCDVPFSKLNPDEIMDVIVHQHTQVIELYRYLYSCAVPVSVKELLENLKTLEEHEAMRMMQSANRLRDL